MELSAGYGLFKEAGKCMKRICLFLSAFVLFSFQLVPQQEYIITERELIELETICQNLQGINQTQEKQIYGLNMSLQKAKRQAANLKTALQKAQKLQQNLTTQLEAEKKASTDLLKSYNKYEKEQDAILTKKQKRIEGLKETVYRRTLALFIAIGIIACFGVALLVKLYMKGKLKIPFP